MYLLQLSTNIHGSVQGKDWRRSLHWNNRSERTFCRLSHRVNIRFGIGWPLGANNRKARSSALSIFFISGGCTCSGWCVISRGSDEVFRPFMRLRMNGPPLQPKSSVPVRASRMLASQAPVNKTACWRQCCLMLISRGQSSVSGESQSSFPVPRIHIAATAMRTSRRLQLYRMFQWRCAKHVKRWKPATHGPCMKMTLNGRTKTQRENCFVLGAEMSGLEMMSWLLRRIGTFGWKKYEQYK